MQQPKLWLCALLFAWLCACTTGDDAHDSGSDAQDYADAAGHDAALFDAATHDSALLDAYVLDAYVLDASGADGSSFDAGFQDAADAAPSNDATVDASDASANDASEDAGSDASSICSDGCDPNQCALGIDDCSSNARCDDLDPGFACTCLAGFSGNGISCTDINECINGTDSCDRNPVACVNTQGSFMCVCPPGYEGDGIASVGCTDIDECARNTDNCTTGIDCINTVGGFSCGCEVGYERVDGSCVDVDECGAGTHNCSVYAVCANTTGGFTCSCPTGFTGNGRTCTDVDECVNNTDNCHANALCTNTPGAFTCSCNSGYAGNGVTCADINECTSGMAPCDTSPLATCANTSGAFTCTCPTGFQGSGVGSSGCLDVNECANNTDNCAANYTCTNTNGSFTCACTGGFILSGGACIDVNECTSNTDNCDTSPEACVNTPGSFMCSCPNGYTGTGVGSSGCADVDECMSGTHNCSANGYCSNLTGSFRCNCNSGYAGDGVTCLPFAQLTNIQVGSGTLLPAFTPTGLSYSVGVALGVTTLPITVTGQGTLHVDGAPVTSGVVHQLPLSANTRVYDITVTRPGYALNTYRLTVVIGAPTYLKHFSTRASIEGQYFGAAAAVDGDTVVIGAPGFSPTSSTQGAAYVFVRSGNTWVTQAQLTEPNPASTRRFGGSVDISGNTIVVGADGANNAYVFVRSGSTWSLQATLRGINTGAGDFFGSDVEIDGDTIAVGAPYEDGSSGGINGMDDNALNSTGAAYVFKRSGTTWTQEAYVKPTLPGQGDTFGTTVAIDGDLLAVGAPWEDSNASGVNGDTTNNAYTDSGAAYLFSRTGTTWTQQAYLKASDPRNNDHFGACVSVDTGIAAVCAQAVYIFTQNAGTWSQHARVQQPNFISYAIPEDVVVVGNRVVFGVGEWPYGGWGINDEYVGTSGGGAAFLYTRNGATWDLTWYVRPGVGGNQRFGASVAYDGTTLVVGDPYESSGATGVNGNPNTPGRQYEGAAHVYF